MRRGLIALLFAWLILPGPVFGDAFQWDSGYKSDAPDAVDVVVSTSNFSGALSSADTNMQAALDTLDDTGTSPAGATYITQTAHAQLSAEQAIGALATGYLKGATTTGVISSQAVPIPIADGGTAATTLTDGGILLGSGTGAITALGVATNGQLPIGDGTTDPVLATLTGTADEITVTNSAGTITLDIPDPMIVGKGGTGAASLTDGGVLFGSGTGAVTPSAVMTEGQLLIGDGTTDPAVATMGGDATLASTGTLTIANNAVALATDTTGAYVAAVTTSVLTGLTGGNAAAENTTSALALDYSQALTGNVGLAANATVFGVTGLVAEGATADDIELFIAIPDPVTTDKTLTLPNATDTLVGKATTDTLTNKTLAAADNVIAADTAVALAANGGNCSAGQYPLGVDASGAVESCTAAAASDISVRVTSAGSVNVSNTTDTVVTFDTETYDTDTMHSTASNTGRLTATTAGKYSIVGQVLWDGDVAGTYRRCWIRLNGTTQISANIAVVAAELNANGTTQIIATQYNLAATDYVELIVRQDSGTTRTVDGTVSGTAFMMVKQN